MDGVLGAPSQTTKQIFSAMGGGYPLSGGRIPQSRFWRRPLLSPYLFFFNRIICEHEHPRVKSANLLLFSSSSLSWTGSISKIWSQSGGSASPNGWATWLFNYSAGYIRKVPWVAKEFNMKIFYECKPGTNPFLGLLLNSSKHKKISSSSWSFCYSTPQNRAILHWLTGPPNYAPHLLNITLLVHT